MSGRSDMDLTVVTPGGPANPSTRVRALQWLDTVPLRADVHGYLGTASVTARTLSRHPSRIFAAERDLRLLAASPRSPNLLLQREASPLSGGGVEARLVSAHRHTAYDLDDALHVPRARASPRRLLAGHRKTAALAAQADVVVAGSDVLADWARGIARRVVRIPSCVALDAYPLKENYRVGSPATVLWLGSASTEPFLHALAPSLVQLARSLPLRVLVVGSSSGTTPTELGGLVERRTWSPAESRAALLEADVGIMPLPDTPFTRGKCAYKLLEYAAAGLPVIGSPVGASAAFLHAAGAPAPRSEQQWTGALREALTANAQTRREMGERAREVVRRHFTYEAWAEEWRATVCP